MKIKTSELRDLALNFAVAKCEGRENDGVWDENFSSNWLLGGPIIERENISTEHMPGAGDAGLDVWVATRIEGSSVSEEQGPTPLVAAMRCYVASQLGDEIEIPNELTQGEEA